MYPQQQQYLLQHQYHPSYALNPAQLEPRSINQPYTQQLQHPHPLETPQIEPQLPTQHPSLMAPRSETVAKRKPKEPSPTQLSSDEPILSGVAEKTLYNSFWQWKFDKTDEDEEDSVRNAYTIFKNELWSFANLRAMSDDGSRIHRFAVERGIPYGMAMGFKAELKLWKQAQRERQVAEGLTGLADS